MHDYLGDGKPVVETELEVGRNYTFINDQVEAYGNMVFLKEVYSRFGFQSYLFEELEAYDEEIYQVESRRRLARELDKNLKDVKIGNFNCILHCCDC